MGLPVRGTNMIVIETTFLAFDCLVVGLRIWVRKTKSKPLEFNDFLIMLGLLFTTAVYVCELIGVVVGRGGRHLNDVLQTQGLPAVIVFGKVSFAADILWNAAVTSIKISILHLYKAIFPTRTIRRQAYALMVICLICGIAFITEELLICRPLAYHWNKSIHGVCGNQELSFLIPGVINLVLDLLIISLPMPILWTLQMQTAKKVATSVVFGIGLVICLLCAIRLKFVLDIEPSDPTWTMVNFGTFGAIEPLLGIISASLPVLPPVFLKLRDYIMSAKWQATHTRQGPLNVSRNRGWVESPLRTEHPDTYHFRRLDDSMWPLQHIPSLDRDFVASSIPGVQTVKSKDPQNSIRVTTDWTVQSKPGSRVP